MQREITEHIEGMAGHGLRTIGAAFSDVADVDAVRLLEDAPTPEMALTIIAVLGIRDPPREASTPAHTGREEGVGGGVSEGPPPTRAASVLANTEAALRPKTP